MEGFMGHHSFAKVKVGPGRPEGGVSIYVRSDVSNSDIRYREENTLVLETDDFVFVLFYLKPTLSAVEVVSSVMQTLASVNFHKPVIISGDFNCRVDAQARDSKGVCLLNAWSN